MKLDVKELLNKLLGVDFRYPVGSYYETSDTTFNPNTAWGGTWVLETEGQVHVSAGANYAIDGALTNTSDGGEAEHTLTTDETPAHTHGSKSLTGAAWNLAYQSSSNQVGVTGIVSRRTTTEKITTGSGSFSAQDGIVINATHEHNSVGGSQSHNNMQPYIVVNRWHRTA